MCCSCVAEVICNDCKQYALTRYKRRFPRTEAISFFVFPSLKEEVEHFNRYGTYSLSAKVFGICAQLGHLCNISAHPRNCFHDRSVDEIIEYEILFGPEERTYRDLEIVHLSEERRELLGCWPLNHYQIQRWLYHSTEDRTNDFFEDISSVVMTLYREDIVEILEEGPQIQLRSTYDCLRSLVELFHSHHL